MSLFSVLLIYFVLIIHGNVAVEIIGGKDAVPHSRPYMALLDQHTSICGGALIKENWVLTAAHCKVDQKTEVILGAHQWQKAEKEQQKFNISRIVQHPDFNYMKKTNDIKLVKLGSLAKLNKFVKLLPLPTSDKDIRAGRMCSTAGWGVTTPDSETDSQVLREANLTIVDRNTCKEIYAKKTQVKAQITNSMLCAGSRPNHKDDACQGDSGGPLICGKRYSGIVSFGDGCGEAPGVYTRLTKMYLKWIKKTIGCI
ncbi:hypothetical protein FKM82_000223 [Ascaphus truei]